MNTVSLFVYAADVIGRISVLLILGGLFLITISAIWMIATGLHNDSLFNRESKKPYPVKKVSWLSALAFLMFLLSVLIPSERAMYMIAASQAGEMAIKTPEAQEMFNDLKDVISKKLKQSLGEGGPK